MSEDLRILETEWRSYGIGRLSMCWYGWAWLLGVLGQWLLAWSMVTRR